MDTLTALTFTGLAIARQDGLLDLPEKHEIPFDEEIVADFIQTMVEDLFDFARLTQFVDNHNLFARAFMYTYGKGAEFALSHMLQSPLKQIGYDFDSCMKGIGTENIPLHLLFRINGHASTLLTMYEEMYQITREGQSSLIAEGFTFGDCAKKMLNGAFFVGKRVAQSFDLDGSEQIDFSGNAANVKYDYDNYDQKYKPEDYRVVNYKFGDFNDIKHLLDDQV